MDGAGELVREMTAVAERDAEQTNHAMWELPGQTPRNSLNNFTRSQTHPPRRRTSKISYFAQRNDRTWRSGWLGLLTGGLLVPARGATSFRSIPGTSRHGRTDALCRPPLGRRHHVGGLRAIRHFPKDGLQDLRALQGCRGAGPDPHLSSNVSHPSLFQSRPSKRRARLPPTCEGRTRAIGVGPLEVTAS